MLSIPSTRIVPAVDSLENGAPLDLDIAGSRGATGFAFWLGRAGDRLWMAARATKRAFVDPEVEMGAWHFGLWYHDCAELFLACSTTGRYLEVNLSPNGAHWVGHFAAPRRADEPRAWDVNVQWCVEDARWTASIDLALPEIVAALGGTPDRGNVTAVLGGCPDRDVPAANLRSLIPIDPDAPDFHVPDRFAEILWS